MMAQTHCNECHLDYDDLYRLTICPHEEFQMNTLAMRADGTQKRCTSIEELDAFMGWSSTSPPTFEGSLSELVRTTTRPLPPEHLQCEQCGGIGYYTTEWSDRADNDPELKRHVMMRPNPPNGTVLFRCTDCQGTGHRPHNPTPAEMIILVHWIMMIMSGTVLACWYLNELEWFAIGLEEWHANGWKDAPDAEETSQ